MSATSAIHTRANDPGWSTATHTTTPLSYPPVYGTSQYGYSAFVVNTQRETGPPADVHESSQFETIATYNDSIRRAPLRSNLRWAIAPGSLKHMDRVLDSPQMQPSLDPTTGQVRMGPNGQGGPGYNTPLPLMSVPGGGAVQGNMGLLGPNTNAPNGIPDWLWARKVVGINNQLLDIPYGSVLYGAVQHLPERAQALNWNVQQPGQPWVPSAAAANYATLHR